MKNFLAILCFSFCILILSKSFVMQKFSNAEFDYSKYSAIPALKAGRVMPLESAANDMLRLFSGKTSYKNFGKKINSVEWFLNFSADMENAKNQKFFRTTNRDLQKLLGIEGMYYSYNDLFSKIEEVEKIANSNQRNVYVDSCYEALQKIETFEILKYSLGYGSESKSQFVDEWYLSIANAKKEILNAKNENREVSDIYLKKASDNLKKISKQLEFEKMRPNSVVRVFADNGKFLTASEALHKRDLSEDTQIYLNSFAQFLDNLKAKNFDKAQKSFSFENIKESKNFRIKFESFINTLDINFAGTAIYGFSFLLFLFSYAFEKQRKNLIYCAMIFLFVAVCLHGFAILARCIIQMRPPVTNLYSSVFFAGWGAALLGYIMAKTKSKYIYALSGTIAGIASLIVAMNLPYSGDDMGMMNAVLNSNFWLTAHVSTIMIGYCAIFLGGFTAAIRLISIAFASKHCSVSSTKECSKSVYVILSIALLFTFIGTMLGGVWADLSWGRFWGWDPKENGALMIVLWCAAALHCKLARMISDRAFLAFAVFGNIVCAWAWFGVNMLGIGLHSYGFFQGKWFWLIAFVASQFLIMTFAFFKESGKEK